MAINKLPTSALEDNSITADLIAAGAITAADITDGEITAAKLAATLDFSAKTFTMANAHVTQAMVTQHQAALSITESQISDLQSYLTSYTETNDLTSAVTWANVPDANITQSSVTQHQAALSITESQISDLQSYVLPNTSPTFANTTLTGYLAGPATFTIDPAAVGDNTGTVVIAGNLQVDGTTTTINSTTVTVDDLNITLASGATNSAAADGAGITIDLGSDGTTALTWNHAKQEFYLDKPLHLVGDQDLLLTGSNPNAGTLFQYGQIRFGDTVASQYVNHARIESQGGYANTTDLRFHTSSNNSSPIRMYISPDGKVGIGTASPAGKFHVVGSGGVTGGTPQNSGSGNQIVIENNASGGSADIQLLGPTNGYNHIFFGDADDANIGVIYYNHINNSLNFTTNANTGVMIFTSDGNIGIGTNSPAYTIDVHKNASGNTDVMRLKGYAGNAFVRFQDSDNSSDWTFGADDNSGLGSNALIAYDRLNTAYRWALDSAGRMYLGTTTSSSHKVNIRSDQDTGIVINAVNAYSGSGTSTMLNLTNNTDTDIQFVINEVGAATKYASIGPSVTGRALVLGAPSGNVGIGTTSPSDILTISQGGASKYIRMEGPSSGDIAGGLQLFRGSTLRASFYANPTHNLTILSETGINFRSNGGERFRVDHAQANMVHVQGDTADHTGTGGGSRGFSIATGGGTSCPIYFGSETNSAQKSMYLNGYWIYLRGHQNEGIRFVFSQGGGTAIRSDQYQFKYNSAYRPTGNTTWDGFSDARAKENVQPLTNALDTIGQLNPVTFDWTDDYADRMNMFEMDTTDEKTYNHFSVKENGYDLDRKTAQIGFIAQEFETVFPKSITETEMQLGDTTVEDFKTVNYDHLIPTLTKAIQELKAENDALKARLDAAGL